MNEKFVAKKHRLVESINHYNATVRKIKSTSQERILYMYTV